MSSPREPAREPAVARPDHPDPGPPRSAEVGVYVISVAAELLGIHPQTLRAYERQGLIEPSRTPGGTRRYSPADLVRARRVIDLSDEGLPLAAIARILALEDQVAKLSRD